MSNRAVADALLTAWLTATAGPQHRAMLADDFWFDGGEFLDADDFITRIEIKGLMFDVRMLSTAEDGDVIMTMLDATDEITMLRYRIAWAVQFCDGLVVRIL